MGIALDASGNAYVADNNNSTIRKIAADGTVTTIAGTAGTVGWSDGQGAAASFDSPIGVAIDSSSNLYVTDYGTDIVRKITPSGTVTTLAGTPKVSGSADGTGALAQFYEPRGIAVDVQGNVFVADTGNSTIRKITPTGVVSTFAGTAGVYGSSDGTGTAASFRGPTGIAIDSANNLYVTDTGNYAVRKITSAGVVTTLFKAPASATTLMDLTGIVLGPSGNIFVVDAANQIVEEITSATTATVVTGVPAQYYGLNILGPLPGSLCAPKYLAIDVSGTFYMTAGDAVLKIRLN
jgi:sugar lactone lactonase YvrE